MSELDFSRIVVSRVGNPRGSNFDVRLERETGTFYLTSAAHERLGLGTRGLLAAKDPATKKVYLISTAHKEQKGVFAQGKTAKKFKRDTLVEYLQESDMGNQEHFRLEQVATHPQTGDTYFSIIPVAMDEPVTIEQQQHQTVSAEDQASQDY
jgi:hypothetical protein